MPILNALAQAPGAGPSALNLFLPFILIFFIWWLLLIRPQRQQEKRHREMLSALSNGDKVVTTGGLLGTVVQVGDKTLKLRIADNVKIEVLRSAIASKQSPEAEPGGDRAKES